jgi:hypothetical protein
VIRRINTNHKFKEKNQPQERLDIVKTSSDPESEDKYPKQETPVLDKQARQENCLPVATAIKILAGELQSGGHEDTLCRAAVRLAEEGGIIAGCRAQWNAAQEGPAGCLPIYLFDRRQCLELIRYHQNKGNSAALKKEINKLVILEGRLLLGQSPPLKVTEEDLAKLEEFIRESGF